MKARLLWVWLLGAPAWAMPITHYEPGYGNAGPIVLVDGRAPATAPQGFQPTPHTGADGAVATLPRLLSRLEFPGLPETTVEDNLSPSVTLVHDHWINNRGYKSESGTHCCDHRSSNGDCDEIDPDTIKPTPAGQGYLTPKGRVGNRSTYISEDGKTYLCSPPNGPPRCLFIRSGG